MSRVRAQSETLDFWIILSRPGPVESEILDELAPTFRSSIRAFHGVALRYLEGGEGPPLVLVHGRGGAATSWFPVLRRLAKRHRVIAVDLPGFGHAGMPPFRSDDPEQALRYFVEPVEALARDLDLGPAAFVGHSLGGLVSLEVALRRRVPVERLGLIASMGLSPQVTAAARVYFHTGPERVDRWLGGLTSRLDAKNWDGLDRRLSLSRELGRVSDGRRSAVRAFNVLCPLIGTPFHRRSRLREIDIPTLLVWGDQDPVFPSPIAIDAAALLPRAELSLQQAGHSPHHENPEPVVRAIDGFLSRTESVRQVAG